MHRSDEDDGITALSEVARRRARSHRSEVVAVVDSSQGSSRSTVMRHASRRISGLLVEVNQAWVVATSADVAEHPLGR